MAGNFGANQYKQMSIKTANRGQILIMLYEAAIQHIKRAILAIEKDDRNAKGVSIGKAHDIINELMNTLDFNVGGKIAEELERLYQFMTEQLVKANVENNVKILDDIAKNLITLLAAWKEAVEQVNKSQAANKEQGQ
jgi:flagellar protein FliS